MAHEKTNAMRLLEQEHLPYTAHTYPHGKEAVDGPTVAGLLGRSPWQVFKTLVAKGAGREPYVFVVPVAAELSLKKAARAVGEKAVSLVPAADLSRLTGYVRGGCSPVGMKKQYATVIDASAQALKTLVVSGGKIGWQIELEPAQLARVCRAKFEDIIQAE